MQHRLDENQACWSEEEYKAIEAGVVCFISIALELSRECHKSMWWLLSAGFCIDFPDLFERCVKPYVAKQLLIGYTSVETQEYCIFQ